MPDSPFYKGLSRYFSERQLEKIQASKIGIAGLGGLGSNLALCLARCGVGGFCLVDHDRVDWSNLNRQQYWPEQVGQFKTDALAETLTALNPDMRLTLLRERLTRENLPSILAFCPIWAEALDRPESKAMFVNAAAGKASFLVCASGICGIGGEPLKVRKTPGLEVVGDFCTGYDQAHPYAPRVLQAASLMADRIMAHILAM